MAHPAQVRQAARIASAAETTNAPTPKFYSQNQAMKGTSAYGPLRKSLFIDVEGAAGSNAGVFQVATQDLDVIQACNDAVKEGFLTVIGALI